MYANLRDRSQVSARSPRRGWNWSWRSGNPRSTWYPAFDHNLLPLSHAGRTSRSISAAGCAGC